MELGRKISNKQQQYLGKGKVVLPDGLRNEGEWENDMANGYVVIMFTDGSTYEGQVINAQRYGYGKITREDGTVEVGDWKEGEFTEFSE